MSVLNSPSYRRRGASKRRAWRRPEAKQPTPQELTDAILDFIKRKFYEGRSVAFLKDRRRLLLWVVLRLAAWLDERGVTITAARYREIMVDRILMNAVRFGDTSAVSYFPAWLAKVVESHLAHHGEEYYEEAKSVRSLVETAIIVAGKSLNPRPDPVRELAVASRLLRASGPRRPDPTQVTGKGQLSLL